ncbi:hypothetical protein CK203_087929 [Vitis vinifera]|uniref:Retrotransposon gag domain-containing protein n=1 Tax=Vitis vinifera TaxID=29760 RepID=A0A438D7Z5_VITVI|nr:hypothetical protein CK203_087929 [Vitis vinifera]
MEITALKIWTAFIVKSFVVALNKDKVNVKKSLSDNPSASPRNSSGFRSHNHLRAHRRFKSGAYTTEHGNLIHPRLLEVMEHKQMFLIIGFSDAPTPLTVHSSLPLSVESFEMFRHRKPSGMSSLQLRVHRDQYELSTIGQSVFVSDDKHFILSLDLPSWVRVEGKLVQFAERFRYGSADPLPPLPPPPVSSVPQALPYLLHGHSEIAPPVVVQTTVIDNAHACMDNIQQHMRQLRYLMVPQFRMISRHNDEAHRLDESQMITLFPLSPSGATQHWFASLESSRHRTWDNLAQEFLRQFSFNTVVDVLRRELKALRQRSNESISSFISHWHRKIAEIIDRPLERDKIHMVLRSLQPRITRHVVGVPFIDFGSVVLPCMMSRMVFREICGQILPLVMLRGRNPPEDRETVLTVRHVVEPGSSKLTEVELLTALTPRPPPQPVPPQSRWIYTVLIIRLSVTTNPLPIRTTHAVPSPVDGIHFLDFAEFDNHIHIVQTSFVLIPDVEEVQTPYINHSQTPDVQYILCGGRLAGIFQHLPDALIRALSQIRVETTTTSERPTWIHRAWAISSSLHQKVKFIHDVRSSQCSLWEIFHSAEPVLQISHSDDNLFLTGSRSTAWASEFMTIPDHMYRSDSGFIPIEADYRYMARLRKERVRARLTHTPFDYLVHPYTLSLADYFVRASKPQTHLDRIIGRLNTTQKAKIQRLVHKL